MLKPLWWDKLHRAYFKINLHIFKFLNPSNPHRVLNGLSHPSILKP